MPKKLPLVRDVERLPPLYDGWMKELLRGGIPRETKATCGTCPMVDGDRGYRADTKCCTYHPRLPNFLVGSALADPATEAHMQRALRTQVHLVSPLGLLVPRDYLALYGVSTEAFGRARALRCPHYDEGVAPGKAGATGGCSIWRHRNAVCTTYFCAHDRPLPGDGFWTAARDLLGALEESLSVWALLEVGFPSESLERALLFEAKKKNDVPGGAPLHAHDHDRTVSDELTSFWRGWDDAPEALYRETYALVSGLDFDEALALLGIQGRFRSQRLQQRYGDLLRRTVPPTCSVAEMKFESTSAKTVTIFAESHPETLEVPNAVLQALALFRQGNVKVALEELRERGTPMEPALLQELFDYGILRKN